VSYFNATFFSPETPDSLSTTIHQSPYLKWRRPERPRKPTNPSKCRKTCNKLASKPVNKPDNKPRPVRITSTRYTILRDRESLCKHALTHGRKALDSVEKKFGQMTGHPMDRFAASYL